MSTSRLNAEDRLIADLAGAVDRGEIVAYYQPQIDLRTGAIVAVESLSRWLHPELGMQSPLVFIPIAEEFGLIDQIGEFMISEACRCARDLAARGVRIEVSVNVSALQFARTAFFDYLAAQIEDCALARDSLTLEITESRFIANRPEVARRLGQLRDEGVGVSIDDFGVGHSSVEQVLALPANELKIDRTIVQDAQSADLLATIVLLAKDRGLRTVAEGVETERQLARVRELECDRAQGYLIGKPMPLSDLDDLITERFA
jgi:EAL domain-containing protein (putative c-di-GMP-specific phosphodiesterase class I)